MKEYTKYVKELFQFIDNSPTAFHAVANAKKMLSSEGFTELSETENWELEGGGSYFVIRNDSSVIAFRLPKATEQNGALPAKGFHLAASHCDSPTFKVKEEPEITVENKYIKLNTEKYGGLILSTWTDRALSVAGRVVVRDKKTGNLESRLVNIDKDLLVIPNVAIHMNREMNKGMEYNPQIDMAPLFAECGEKQEKGLLIKKAAKAAGVRAGDILGHDLFLYVREKGKTLGEKGEFIFCPRLDDLQCAYSSLAGFLQAKPREYINVCAVFDNEEVGSGTRQGANSTFLEDVVFRICEGLGLKREERLRMIADSFLISADNAHAVHPNHPEKADPTNRPYINGGIVIKYHGGQKYTTDGISAARMKQICEKAGVPYQTFFNRSDMEGGSTLGNLSNSHVSVSSVDIGLPQFAMHSAMETAGVKDTAYAVKAFAQFWQE